jgi:ferredoxin
MPKLNFIKPDGSTHQLEVDNGTTIMEAGRDNNMGLEGTCGGSLSCATCHVIFSDQDFAIVGPPSEDEMDMLELAFGVSPTSRLGCQIRMNDDLDGISVRVPDDL